MSAPPHPPRLRVVSVNDVYSLENLARLRSLVRHYAEPPVADPSTALIVVLAGDFLAPSLLSSIDAGRGMVDCMNAVGFTHVILGNHEDDVPVEELRARLGELHAMCLGTNLRGPVAGLDLPRHDVIQVAEGISVGVVGVVMADASVYRRRPFGGVPLEPANDAVREEAALLTKAGCAAVVPLTHQSIADDRALAASTSEGQGPRFPVIIGGHEHLPFRELVSGTWIVKAGAEAARAVVTELTWPDGPTAAPTVEVRVEEVSGYPEDPTVQERVESHMSRVRELAMATLLYLPPGQPLSSKGTRAKQTTMGTLVCSKLRDALGADACLYNGGGIRGSSDYPYRFTYGDLESELPFENEVVVVKLEGAVVREAIAASRAHAPLESGAFLQVDDQTVVDDATNRVVAIAGAPLDPHRTYSVAVVREMLAGMDLVEPLVHWAAEDPHRIPPAGSGREPKMVLVQAFAVAIWRELGGFDALDTDHDGRITGADVAAAVARAHPSRAPSSVLVDLVVRAVDADADRVISREDAASLGDPARAISEPGLPLAPAREPLEG